MAIILNIDTATDKAGICMCDGKNMLGLLESEEQKNHASFIQPAIEILCGQTGISLREIDAVAVTGGPGSYTGLRVGMATAKGICFALSKPLVLVNTLEVLAQAMVTRAAQDLLPGTMLCPLIDARRMEVFTAFFDTGLNAITEPQAMILTENSFSAELAQHPILFGGSGMPKLKAVLQHPNASFTGVTHTVADLAHRSLIAYQSNRFADLAYSEPLYVKPFFDTSKLKSD